ncbi:VOC family protein [Streptomyces sp. P1-3]|uniref:VOC family protein n=1 Tax=Streptomyces sp. P1-3 TaxID=3421658 RepID=UPI003D36A2B9
MAAFQEGVPCWTDATLPDVEAGKRFYGELFGWTFEPGEVSHGFYVQAFHEGKNVAALAPKPDGRMPTVWNIYLAADDAAATAARIRDAGGQVIIAPVPVGDFGTIATAADPGGAVFGLWQAGSHGGFEKQGEPGSYIWTEVYTRDKGAVDAFYTEVFGYGTQSVAPSRSQPESPPEGAGGGFDFLIWSPAGQPVGTDTAIGGRAVLGGDVPAELPAHFLVYFAVADCDGAVQAVRRLGGRLVAGPQDTPYGRFAIVVDNQGADFAVVETPKAA